MKTLARTVWMLLIALASSPGAAAATQGQAQAAIARAIVHLSPALQARIESSKVWYQTPRTPTKPAIYFSMHADPCRNAPAAGCEVSGVDFRLRAQAPLPGTCVREFVTVTVDQMRVALPPQTHGDRRIALGSDCAAIDASGFARLAGVGLSEAARLLLWLQTQQALIGQQNQGEVARIECAQRTPSQNPQEGCAGGAKAAFARLPLSSTRELGLIEWGPDGHHWQHGQHFQVSIWPHAGGMGYRLQVHREPDAPARITMQWEPPAPF